VELRCVAAQRSRRREQHCHRLLLPFLKLRCSAASRRRRRQLPSPSSSFVLLFFFPL
jgi:hypothetical protein